MIASTICGPDECQGLFWLLLAALAVGALVAITVLLAWATAISAVLERQGWGPAKRRIATVLALVGGIAVLALCSWLSDIADLSSNVSDAVTWLLIILAVPVAIWQRSVTKRYRADQSIA
jgi:hypothetical protein